LRNLLRLHRPEVSLVDRVAEFSVAIEGFAAWLQERADSDESCIARITSATVAGGTAGDRPTDSGMAQTVALIGELRAREEWLQLEVRSRRMAASNNPQMAALAKAAMVESLMHSDEGPKRAEAVALADQLVAEPDATVDDYLLAAGASDVQGDTGRSVELVTRALEMWPNSAQLVTYARGLVTRSGDTSLRSVLDSVREARSS
jgi:hypothetical protein